MFRFFAVIAVLLLTLEGTALAQQAPAPHPGWDFALTAGSFHGHPDKGPQTAYQEDWYHDAEGRLTIGHYWSAHLKTEVEFGQSGEGERFVQHFSTAPGSTNAYLYSTQDFFRVRQASARVAWQFLENQWIHPYLFAGLSVDEERKRTIVHDPRTGRPQGASDGPRTTYLPGVVAGGGLKWYVSSNLFVKTAGQVGYAKPSRSVSFQLGIGVDF
jgi:hypothetical protein